uniref:Peptidase_M14 domain-containing protein n=1 Tax=Macrostomum lignano TaxID=282301 RepID=A0A1I8FH39_9PLAT
MLAILTALLARSNANGIDLNRNFPDQFRAGEPDEKPEQPETAAVRAWLARAPDDATFRQLARAYSSSTPVYDQSAQMSSLPHRTIHRRHLTNGAQWYSLYGGMQDYNYLNTNCFELTLELSCNKHPYAAELPSIGLRISTPLVHVRCAQGVRGFVLDFDTGAPLSAVSVLVDGIDHAVLTAQDGDYWETVGSCGRTRCGFVKRGRGGAVAAECDSTHSPICRFVVSSSGFQFEGQFSFRIFGNNCRLSDSSRKI